MRRLTLDLARHEKVRVTVVFDGPPPSGSPQTQSLGPVAIRYAGSRSADDVIVTFLPAGAAARDWVVVTDDRELGARVRRRGGRVRSLRERDRRVGGVLPGRHAGRRLNHLSPVPLPLPLPLPLPDGR